RYQTQASDDRWLADYEKALLRYEHTPQPSLVGVTLAVDIQPRAPALETRGVYVLENDTGAPLREAHFRFDRPVIVRALSLQGARPTRTYERFNYRIFTFDTPMAPGERRTLSFDTLLRERGFRSSRRKTRDLTQVVANGTFVNSEQIAPVIGMSRDRLLTDRGKRRRYGLQPDLHPAPLGDVASRQRSFLGFSGRATSDITVITDADQTPIAPGDEVSDGVDGGRRTARFVNATPSLPFFSIQSARYAHRTVEHHGVALTVYYDPRHATNVDRMLRALAAALDYDTANFGPYPFRYVRIVEFPDYDQFAQSFAGTFPWSEGLGFIADTRDRSRIDMVSYVAAHELAHQWWGHQLVPADQQGETALVETLAQYSALRVMRRLEGPSRVRKFLKYELDSYLKNRGGEGMAEQPLERVEDQPYIHYRKGSLVMDRLADEIGEARVNAALRDLLARFGSKGAPYPTALDLVAALRAWAPPDKQNLITDLFERITLYDLRALNATARHRADGRWNVNLTVRATKLYADGLGRERPAPMDETVDIGLFTARPDSRGFGPGKIVAFEKRPIHSGVQTLAFVTDRRPAFAGIDPYADLIQRDVEGSLTAVR
ncbi:MAG: M1 family aminopeptidase, partial [Caulobacteraceae bacterium]